MCSAQGDICFVPIADIAPLFDDLVGGSKERLWDTETKRIRGFAVDDEFILGRLLHWKIGRPSPFKDLTDVGRPPSE